MHTIRGFLCTDSNTICAVIEGLLCCVVTWIPQFKSKGGAIFSGPQYMFCSQFCFIITKLNSKAVTSNCASKGSALNILSPLFVLCWITFARIAPTLARRQFWHTDKLHFFDLILILVRIVAFPSWEDAFWTCELIKWTISTNQTPLMCTIDRIMVRLRDHSLRFQLWEGWYFYWYPKIHFIQTSPPIRTHKE